MYFYEKSTRGEKLFTYCTHAHVYILVCINIHSPTMLKPAVIKDAGICDMIIIIDDNIVIATKTSNC